MVSDFDKHILLFFFLHIFLAIFLLFMSIVQASTSLDFVFYDGGGGQVFDSLKVCGGKYGDLITVITKFILNNQRRLSQYSN